MTSHHFQLLQVHKTEPQMSIQIRSFEGSTTEVPRFSVYVFN